MDELEQFPDYWKLIINVFSSYNCYYCILNNGNFLCEIHTWFLIVFIRHRHLLTTLA